MEQKKAEVAGSEPTQVLNGWEREGYRQLAELKMYDPAHRRIIGVPEQLPPELTLNAAIILFIATLTAQSKQTSKTYRVGCRRLMWFIYSTEGGRPDQLPVVQLSPAVLEDFYLWLVETYGKQARATIGAYMAGARNLFDYLASRELSPGGVQFARLVARLGKMQGRASYKTPDSLRIRGRQAQIEQVAYLAARVEDAPPDEKETVGTGNNGKISPEAGDNKSALTTAEENPGSTSPQTLIKPVQARAKNRQAEAHRRQLEDLRDRAVILTLFTTGMRREEVTTLNRTELEGLLSERQSVTLVKNETGFVGARSVYDLIITGKGQKERVVYFDDITLEAVEQYLALRGKDHFRPLFLQHHRGRDHEQAGPNGEAYRIGERTVWVTVKKYARQLGLTLKPHDFRHNLATTLLNAGAQLSEVQDILGHASPTTTKQIYAHYDKGHLKEAFARFGKSAGHL